MDEKQLPDGFMFNPTEVELVRYYLKRKLSGEKLPSQLIPEVDVYKFAPWDLPDMAGWKGEHQSKWHFFCPRSSKYHHSSFGRANRATDIGYWKIMGKDRAVSCKDGVVGMHKTLVFYQGRPPSGERTDWIMHEYRIDEQVSAAKDHEFFLCVIFRKDGTCPKTSQKPDLRRGSSDLLSPQSLSSVERGTSCSETSLITSVGGAHESFDSKSVFDDIALADRSIRKDVTRIVRVSSDLEQEHDDGFSWRKYGQKDILGAKYPRSYYKCIYSSPKGCLAAKIVQRSDEEMDVFVVTYRGEHTCNVERTTHPPLHRPSKPEIQEQMSSCSSITFSEPGTPQEVTECDDHLDTSQETTAVLSFNSLIQTTTSKRASSSSVNEHHHQDNKNFFSPPFKSPSTSAAGDFFRDGHDSYENPDSELSNNVNGCTSLTCQTVVNELIQGMEVAKQLELLLNATSSIDTRELVLQIVSSYEKAIMTLNRNGSIGAQPHDAGVATAVVPGSPRSPNATPPSDGDLDGVAKESQAPPFETSKKRKTVPRWTYQVRVNPENGLEGPQDDGFSWRKYGQKDILGAAFPRSYYRCTYRNLEGCWATKQVQRSDENHDVFEVTYRGEHTCKIARTDPSKPEIQEQRISTITFSELAKPQEIIECDDHLDTSQETTVVPSFNSLIHFLKETTTSSRDCTYSIIDHHHHHRDNKDFRGSFSPSFESPSTSAADDSFFGDDYESYGNPDSELNNILNGDEGICVSTGAEEELVNCIRLENFDLKTDYLLLLLVHWRSIAPSLRAECLVEVYLPGSDNALVQDLVNLKQLDLSCSSFTKMPDLSRACKLQSLDLHCCKNLVDVSSIQYLTKLEYINLKGCTSLIRLPSLMELKFLLSLDVSDCINLRRLPPSLGSLSSLTALDLRNCKRIQNLPKGILRLKSVQTLSISGCSMLMERASSPKGMVIEHQVNPRAHSSSHASDEEVSMSYIPVDKYVPKILLQQPEEERIISKYNSMASKDAAESSSTTEDLELHKEVLKAYLNMPVEKIHEANAFYDVQITVDSLIRRSPDLHESASLHDLMYCLEELQENVPETMSRMHDARVSKASIQVKLAHLHSSFVQSEGHYNGLAARLSVISDEEEDLDAEIDRLLAKRRELLD